MPTGRQGNLIVTSSQTVPEKDMRQKLIDEIKKQNKPYGLYFDEGDRRRADVDDYTSHNTQRLDADAV